MSDATPPAGFGRPDLTAFARLDGLDLSVTGQRLEPDRAVLACRVVEPDQWCRRCGSEGAARDTVIRRLAHEPLGWRPTVLEVVVRRYRCADCGHVWRQDTSAAAEPRAKLSRTGLRWALEGIVVAHLTVARVAEGLGVAWDTANNAVLAEGKRLLINDPTRFEGVKVIGVDGHVWRHTRRGDKYVTVIIDLTPVRDGAGPARLLDMVEGRSKAAFKTWLADRDDAFRDAVEVVAMDGFTGFKTAAAEEIPDAVTVMDPDRPHQSVPREDFTEPAYEGYEHAIVARTCRALAAATRSSDDCYFAIWAGYSGVVSPLPGGPRMHIPNRDYHLYVGTLSDLKAWEQPLTHETPALLHDPPAFVWPADRAWCLASDVDLRIRGSVGRYQGARLAGASRPAAASTHHRTGLGSP